MNHLSSISRAGACLLILALSSCYPQTANPEQLRVAHEQNAALRQEIVKCMDWESLNAILEK